MNSHVLNRILKIYQPLKIMKNSISNTQRLNAKKRFSVKNKFTYQNEFQRILTKNEQTESRAISPPDLLFEENEGRTENTNDPDLGFISSDLLANERVGRHHNLKTSRKTKNYKPSLRYQGEILFGVHPIHLALLKKRRTFYHLYTREETDLYNDNNSFLKTEIVRIAKSMDIPVSYVDSKGLRILAPGAVHQGVCLDAGFLPLPTWDENHFKIEESEKNLLWLILDEILDPMNVGAIIRSAYYFGVDKVFTVKGNSCKLSPTVSKASSGSLEIMDIYQIDHLENFIKKRKENNWSIVSTSAYSEPKSKFDKPIESVSQFQTCKNTILILGNEGRGISENIFKLCDSLISIEPGQTLSKGIDSLNVSVATGVVLYVLSSQKKITER